MAETTRKISDIQVLRGIAITMVVFCHLGLSTAILAAVLPSVSNPFYIGVEMFFVISGFVVTRSLRRGHYQPISFLLKRGFRLYPPILFFLALTGAIEALVRLTGQPAYAYQALCPPADAFLRQAGEILGGYLIDLPGSPAYVNGAMWSLSVEFQFYLAATAVALAAWALQLPRRIKDAIGLGIAGTILAIGIVLRVLSGFGSSPDHARFLVTFGFDFLALGVVLAYVEPLLPTAARPLRGLTWFVLAAPLVVLAMCRAPLSVASAGADSLQSVGMLSAASCYGVAILLAARGRIGMALPAWAIRSMFYVGERSYTIYLLHIPCMLAGWILIVFVHVQWAMYLWSYAAAQPIAAALFLLPLTEACYRWIELPCIALGRRVLRRMQQPASAGIGVVLPEIF